MTVKVDDVVGISGFIMPGTVVDVVVVITPTDTASQQGQGPISKIVLQSIKVLANGQNIDKPEKEREVLVRWTTIDPDAADGLLRLLELDFASGASAALRSTAEQLIQLNPMLPQSYRALGKAGRGAGSDPVYVETSEGRLINAKGWRARYVRLYSDGNTMSALNHYVEVEVFGQK